MVSGQVDEAFARLVGLVRRVRDAERDRARVHLLGLYDTLPADDPSVLKSRRALASALF
jgi:putative thioredoxin